ncbi:PglZ domain-containing protein [Salinibacter ruber]|uniref:PglZ domain-containing protein n=1 Tax=Salinibacter ruber TaxID=146919 RepID=UPI002167797F|nr:PglZ domain-containing protein [Salinibacter ruber]MCS4201501.1 hypothetical protein [Salinibacter ruber]
MTVLDYVSDLFKRRLDREECLVVYDPAERYRPAVEDLDESNRTIIYGEEGTIEGREAAMATWTDMGEKNPGGHELLIYLTTEKPSDDEAKMRDPYSPFIIGGGVFPSRADADSYEELCVRAKENHEEQIRALFEEDEEPDLATVEAVGGGASWPRLRTVLDVESDREIVRSLLCPSDKQRRKLEQDQTWWSEYETFASRVLGFEPTAGSESLDEMQDELARYVLFSEFVFDLPDEEPFPESLADVPRADSSKKKLIYAVCGSLRTSKRHEERYKDLARTVVQDLSLEQQTEGITDFGKLDTFPFEERAFLNAFVGALQDDDREEARSILEDRESSIWAYSEEQGSDWVLARRLLNLLEAIEKQEGTLDDVGDTLADLVEYYVSDGRRVDTLHRTLEQTVQEKYWQTGILDELVQDVRRKYRAFADQLQRMFIDRVDAEGWPPTKIRRQTQVFDETIAPSLTEHGRRVAFVMVDAFRYELAAAFADRLSNEVEAKIEAAAATVPTTTRVGMSALLPGAEGDHYLGVKDGKIVPKLDGEEIIGPDDRLSHLQKTYGDRCAMADLDALLRGDEEAIDDTVQLLLVKTREIDTAGESMNDGIERHIDTAQEKYLRAASALGKFGFEEIHFVTDHGFLLLSEQEPGDGVEKPAGNWAVKKERSLLGTGSKSTSTLVSRIEELGIDGDFDHMAVPRMLGAFRMGSKYMHSGMSLQECVLPVLSVKTATGEQEDEQTIDVRLSYRGKREGWVTTRRPMIEIEAAKQNMFGEEAIEFRLEARSDGQVVGHAAQDTHVDPSTSLVEIEFGDSVQESVKVPLSMKDDFEGEFEIVAVNPITQIRFDAITLKTDYLE